MQTQSICVICCQKSDEIYTMGHDSRHDGAKICENRLNLHLDPILDKLKDNRHEKLVKFVKANADIAGSSKWIDGIVAIMTGDFV